MVQDKRFDSANSLITNTMNALNEMTGDRTSSRMCVMIGVLFVALVILYQFFKKH